MKKVGYHLVKTLLLMIGGSIIGVLHAAEPTEERNWTSVAGTTLTASAVAMKDSIVAFETPAGKTIKVPLSKLVAADRQLLTEHFREKTPEAIPPEDLPHPLGEQAGPVQASSKSSYFIYLPTTLSTDVKAPILMWTNSGRSSARHVKLFQRAAELTGMVISVNVEAKNLKTTISTVETNWAHASACLEDMEENLPVDMDRVFFSGSSGGGASAFYNASKLKRCAGAFPMIGYIPLDCQPRKKGYYYISGGARDPNRYLCGTAAKNLGDHAIHRMHAGAHNNPKEEGVFEGIVWLYTRELYANREGRNAEIARFEDRFHAWLTGKLADSPHLAHFWTDHLLNTCEITGLARERFVQIHEETSKDDANIRYLDAYLKLQEFSTKYYATVRKETPIGHTSSKIEQAAELLAQEITGVPELGDVAKELGGKTALK